MKKLFFYSMVLIYLIVNFYISWVYSYIDTFLIRAFLVMPIIYSFFALVIVKFKAGNNLKMTPFILGIIILYFQLVITLFEREMIDFNKRAVRTNLILFFAWIILPIIYNVKNTEEPAGVVSLKEIVSVVIFGVLHIFLVTPIYLYMDTEVYVRGISSSAGPAYILDYGESNYIYYQKVRLKDLFVHCAILDNEYNYVSECPKLLQKKLLEFNYENMVFTNMDGVIGAYISPNGIINMKGETLSSYENVSKVLKLNKIYILHGGGEPDKEYITAYEKGSVQKIMIDTSGYVVVDGFLEEGNEVFIVRDRYTRKYYKAVLNEKREIEKQEELDLAYVSCSIGTSINCPNKQDAIISKTNKGFSSFGDLTLVSNGNVNKKILDVSEVYIRETNAATGEKIVVAIKRDSGGEYTFDGRILILNENLEEIASYQIRKGYRYAYDIKVAVVDNKVVITKTSRSIIKNSILNEEYFENIDRGVIYDINTQSFNEFKIVTTS